MLYEWKKLGKWLGNIVLSQQQSDPIKSFVVILQVTESRDRGRVGSAQGCFLLRGERERERVRISIRTALRMNWMLCLIHLLMSYASSMIVLWEAG